MSVGASGRATCGEGWDRPARAKGFGWVGLRRSMGWAIFLRGANVGGHRKFLPSAFAEELAEFDVVNLGAAGTFVARSEVSETRLRKAIVAKLPFETEVVIRPGVELEELLRSPPSLTPPPSSKLYLSILIARATRAPPLPLHVPNEPAWEVKVLEIRGRYALSFARRLGDRLIYPNPVVERAFGVGATTRGWPTIVALGRILEEG